MQRRCAATMRADIRLVPMPGLTFEGVCVTAASLLLLLQNVALAPENRSCCCCYLFRRSMMKVV